MGSPNRRRYTPSMRRLLPIAIAAGVAAAAAHLYAHRSRPVDASGNGHSPDSDRTVQLRVRLGSIGRRLRDEFDALRGD